MVVVNGKVWLPMVAVPVTVTAPWSGMVKDSGVGSAQANGGPLLGPTNTVSLLGSSWLPALSLAQWVSRVTPGAVIVTIAGNAAAGTVVDEIGWAPLAA